MVRQVEKGVEGLLGTRVDGISRRGTALHGMVRSSRERLGP